MSPTPLSRLLVKTLEQEQVNAGGRAACLTLALWNPPIHLPLWVHSWSPKDLSPEAVATGGQAILSVMISQRPSTVTHASDPSIPLGEAGMANLRLI